MKIQFNQELVYPRQRELPEWVKNNLTQFHTKVKESTNKNLSIRQLQDELIDILESNILHPKIKIKKVLNSNEIGNILNKTEALTTDIEFMYYYYLLMQAGFTISTIIPSSFQPEALELPKEFVKEKDELVKIYESSEKTTEDAMEFQNNVTKIAKKVKKYFEDNSIDVVDLLNSGAKGNVSHIQSLLLSVGLSLNSFGEINDVISNSHSEGMTQTQFFNGSSQAIQALYAKSSDTAKPGYAGRKLSAITEGIKLSTVKNCNTTKYLELKIRDSKMIEALIGRYYKSKVGIERQINESSDLIGEKIKLRSPLYCKAKDGICERCYNEVYIQRIKATPGENIGLLAATGFTGSLVNLTLKKSHVGITLDKEEVDFRQEIKDM